MAESSTKLANSARSWTIPIGIRNCASPPPATTDDSYLRLARKLTEFTQISVNRVPFRKTAWPFCFIASMWSTIVALAALLGACSAALAHTRGGSNPASPWQQCRAAISAAEHAHHLPHDLLAAIGMVESGRRDPAGHVAPWPWTIDVGGRAALFSTKAEAITAVRALQAKGVQSIDIGCVQINLAQHPDAFSTLEAAFDPAANANYGARFLNHLFAMTGDWHKAAAFYHSATPGLAATYARKVFAIWTGADSAWQPCTAAPAPPKAPTPLQQLALAWAATLSDPPDPAAAPVTLATAEPRAPKARSADCAIRRSAGRQFGRRARRAGYRRIATGSKAEVDRQQEQVLSEGTADHRIDAGRVHRNQ